MSATAYGDDLLVPSRCRGPARSGNGGYTAGLLAERLPVADGSAVEVTLKQPPPLDVAMKVQYVDPSDGARQAVLLMGGARIAVATVVDDALDPVGEVSAADAKEATTRFAGHESHPFPSCFACGPERPDGDGLRIFPGPVADENEATRVASSWVPHHSFADTTHDSPRFDHVPHVGLGIAWAALDCVGGWAGDIGGRRMVLGRMTALVDTPPVVDEPHVVVGVERGREGRKTFTASTLYDADGRIVGRAEHVWISIDPSAFN